MGVDLGNRDTPDFDSAEVAALIGAFASADVQQAFQMWDSVVVKAVQEVGLIKVGFELGSQRPTSINVPEHVERLGELQRAEREARAALARTISAELGGTEGQPQPR